MIIFQGYRAGGWPSGGGGVTGNIHENGEGF